jgi:hypothetical protein
MKFFMGVSFLFLFSPALPGGFVTTDVTRTTGRDRLWSGLSIRSGRNARENPLHILIGCRLIPGVRRPRRVVLLKHGGNGLGVHLLRFREQTVGVVIVTRGLLVKPTFSEPAGLGRFIAFPLVLRHDSLPCR